MILLLSTINYFFALPPASKKDKNKFDISIFVFPAISAAAVCFLFSLKQEFATILFIQNRMFCSASALRTTWSSRCPPRAGCSSWTALWTPQRCWGGHGGTWGGSTSSHSTAGGTRWGKWFIFFFASFPLFRRFYCFCWWRTRICFIFYAKFYTKSGHMLFFAPFLHSKRGLLYRTPTMLQS